MHNIQKDLHPFYGYNPFISLKVNFDAFQLGSNQLNLQTRTILHECEHATSELYPL